MIFKGGYHYLVDKTHPNSNIRFMLRFPWTDGLMWPPKDMKENVLHVQSQGWVQLEEKYTSVESGAGTWDLVPSPVLTTRPLSIP